MSCKTNQNGQLRPNKAVVDGQITTFKSLVYIIINNKPLNYILMSLVTNTRNSPFLSGIDVYASINDVTRSKMRKKFPRNVTLRISAV